MRDRLVVEGTAIADVRILFPKRIGDARGYLSEVFQQEALRRAGVDFNVVQVNASFSAAPGTVRGLHFQRPPFAQDKLVAVARGAVLDVAVDVRRSSPTFGRHVAARLTAEEGNQLLVPAGFAHGFCTLEPDTMVTYFLSAEYRPSHDAGVRWNDPALGIEWPVAEPRAVLSDRDRTLPLLADAETLFP